jgi:hypothetical protein
MHSKGSFAVQDNMAHGKVLDHGNIVRRCRGVFLCRALISLSAVQAIFVVRWSMPLSCIVVASHGKTIFAVRTAHGTVLMHSNVCFSGSDATMLKLAMVGAPAQRSGLPFWTCRSSLQ